MRFGAPRGRVCCMEPNMSWWAIAQALALAAWPLWFILAALLVVRIASRLGYCAPDEYEEPPVRPHSAWMTDEERKYHGDDSAGR